MEAKNMNTDGRLLRGEARRMLLLDASVRIVAGLGARALTHRAAAKAASVSLASVTYHFPSSADLRRATYEHAGSRLSLQFIEQIPPETAKLDTLPDICGAFAVQLLTKNRTDALTVFEMIVAASHDPELRPVTRLLNERFAARLEPYLGSIDAAIAVGTAMQGLILAAFTLDGSGQADWLRRAVSDLVRRYRVEPRHT
jgi:DNA-binding transcriptional regulator YbjK